VVLTPPVETRSFIATGTPCSGPRYRPAEISASALRASSIARSAVTVINALVRSAPILSSIPSVTSTGETSPVRSAPESPASERGYSVIRAMILPPH